MMETEEQPNSFGTALKSTLQAARNAALEEAARAVEALKTGDRHTRAAFFAAAAAIRALKGLHE